MANDVERKRCIISAMGREFDGEVRWFNNYPCVKVFCFGSLPDTRPPLERCTAAIFSDDKVEISVDELRKVLSGDELAVDLSLSGDFKEDYQQAFGDYPSPRGLVCIRG